ncbi:hypothetical protein LAD12857_35730 [Lacrimispora amygdalina]|uniref:Type I restriction modification DNA specificity domain-containing protein n=1 Tax=Lacrimispora amygdalina TaxID=253257 RepID=A0ABQ5MA42_9FIRM
MKSNYKRLGNYIRMVDIRNDLDLKDNLLGVSVTKEFIDSIANTVGTDFRNYKIVNRNQFTYIPDTSRRGDKIGIALLEDRDEGLVSQAYTVFEVIKTEELLPQYLMMWFRRPEFDRYARFISHGSVREIFSWDDMCDVLLPVPAIEKQREIVNEYNVILDRIELANKTIDLLEKTAQSVYRQWFIEFEYPNVNGLPYKSNDGEMYLNKNSDNDIPKGWSVISLGELCEVKGGKRLPAGEELNDSKNGNVYIKVADMTESKFLLNNDKFQYVEKSIQEQISRYTVDSGDIIVSIVGTIGRVAIIHESLHNANLTENCVRLTKIKKINAEYLYQFLSSPIGQQIIEMQTVGGVQGKLPIYNIQAIPIVIPTEDVMGAYLDVNKRLNSLLINMQKQNALLSELKNVLLSKLATVEDDV